MSAYFSFLSLPHKQSNQKAKRISKATANLSTGKQKALAVDKAVKSHKQSKQSDDKAIT
jgi:hypothetical protein